MMLVAELQLVYDQNQHRLEIEEIKQQVLTLVDGQTDLAKADRNSTALQGLSSSKKNNNKNYRLNRIIFTS